MQNVSFQIGQKKFVLLQKQFRIEKVIKTKVDKLGLKRTDYDNSFNNWIDKKDIFLKKRVVFHLIVII